ncbi:hypothetical protein FW778_20410 [Ginsengibacter hankyongi]|uniref:Uncharacterized protein n=1 Tax=Ginsengibacter hankyongi TaxID=2607284 RepID=A0A5J5ICL8_9BACT|nr:hypothetical protein [Ginsengibacter hankyongi]KAA9035914.1 hypothetical protein FW778_20410 [Ginsengibacter hankyongi]
MSQHKIEGEYYFGKMEMASGFNFTADGKFQFFFSYGAVDRNATGTFSVTGNTLQLKSDKEPGKDFSVTSQSKQAKGYNLIFKDANAYLLRDILCIFITDGQQKRTYSNDSGEVNMGMAHCDTIYVQHTLFPDVATLIKDKANDNNHFTITLNPSLEQVSFKGIDFTIEDDKTLSCLPNYLLPLEDIKYTKQ